jgi:hypothetical protein
MSTYQHYVGDPSDSMTYGYLFNSSYDNPALSYHYNTLALSEFPDSHLLPYYLNLSQTTAPCESTSLRNTVFEEFLPCLQQDESSREAANVAECSSYFLPEARLEDYEPIFAGLAETCSSIQISSTNDCFSDEDRNNHRTNSRRPRKSRLRRSQSRDYAMPTVVAPRQFKCPLLSLRRGKQICGQGFTRPEHLQRHVRSVHCDQRKYGCKVQGCQKLFSRKDNLGDHYFSHLEKGEFRGRNVKLSLAELREVLWPEEKRMFNRLRRRLYNFIQNQQEG